jgi:hypothetical protein
MFVFLDVMELFVIVLALSILIVQVVVPVLLGRPIFPYLDKRKAKLKEREHLAKDNIDKAVWEKSIVQIEKEADTLMKDLETEQKETTDTSSNEKE